MTFHEAQVALAKVYVGSDDVAGDVDEVVNIEKPHDQTTRVDQIGKADTVERAVRLPKTVDEAKEIISRFENALDRSDKEISDNVCQHAFQTETSLMDEKWAGTEETERACYVSEVSRVVLGLCGPSKDTLLFLCACLPPTALLHPQQAHDCR